MRAFEKITALLVIIVTYVLQYVKADCPPGTYGNDGNCKICPPNYYCPGNTAQPFQCPPGYTSFDGEASCYEMTHSELEYRLNRNLFSCGSQYGYYCSGSSSVECSAGNYCPANGAQYACPQGNYCPLAGGTDSIPSGMYSNSGDSDFHVCPRGSYCNGGSYSSCSSGQYSFEGSNGCTNCPAGSKCPSTSQAPEVCGPGYYQTSGSATTCNQCAAGSYCTSPTDSGTTCSSGYYSLAGWTQCKPCPVGYSCSSGILGSACSTGYYSPEGTDSCTQCPATKYCPNKDYPYDCLDGYYSNAGATSCTACPLGSYCVGGVQYICKHLTYTDQTGMTECRKVPTHFKFSPNSSLTGATSVTRCGADEYTDGMHLNCYTCDDAHQCFKDDSVDPCPYGFAKLNNNWYCSPCPPGSICQIQSSGTTATTIASYESGLSTDQQNYPRFSGVAELAPKVCPPNNYCTDDGVNYHICPHGTYPFITGCVSCPDGSFCMTSFNRQVTVTTGSVSSLGDSFPRFQPQGYTWSSSAWSFNSAFTNTQSALGKISNAASSPLLNCPQGYTCTISSFSRCPSTHQGKLVSGEAIGMVAEDQNILHSYNTMQGFTYTYITNAKTDQNTQQCLPCNGGYSCSLGYNPAQCSAGTYSPTGEYECYTCPAGYYCPTKSTTPTACAVNTYNPVPGSTSSSACISCSSGYYAEAGSSICITCPAGYECSTGAPVICPIGTYAYEGKGTCSECQQGYLCDIGSKTPTPPENICPKGSYCATSGSSTLQTKCSKGKYGIAEGATSSSWCIDCPPGFVCREGTDDFTKYPCPQGNYCPSATSLPTQCPAGTYNPKTGGISVGACMTCPAGYYCLIESVTTTICPSGYFCPAGTSSKTQYPCPKGTYSGTRTGARMASDCFPCPLGNYCPEASINPTPAATGYYIPYMGATDIKAAVPCPAGYPCTGTGNYDYKGFTCQKGYYCPPGSSTPVKCPAGTYTDRTDLWSKDQCTVCPSGYYCLEGSTYSDLTICPIGYYCLPGTVSNNQYPCPTGTYGAATGYKVDTDCKNCTAGGGCASGSTTTITCAAGYYCPAGTTTATPANYKAPAGSYIDYTGAVSEYDNKPCGLGKYCPTGSTAPTSCLAGTYSAILRASSCTTCPAGYYCATTGLSAPVECDPGYYSNSGATACTLCPVGYYCHQKATTYDVMITQLCPAGLICSRTVSSSTYGLAVSPNLVDHACPAGKYCTGGYSVADCSAGTYNPIIGRSSSADCLQTPAGFYTTTANTEYLSKPCAAGYYCLAGATTGTQYSCPKGTFRGITGGAKPEDCAMCKSGYQCPNEATVTPTDCGIGKYCPLGTVVPALCPIGTYSANTNNPDSRSCTKCPTGYYCGSQGLTAATGTSMQCDAGFYCILGAIRPDPTDGITGMICPAGGYCLKGATSVSSCPAGQYNPYQGAKDSSSCITCLPGKYCFGSNNPAPTGTCTAGYYCPAGSSSPTQNAVAAGYYAPAGSDFAIPCPRGTYQPSTLQSSCIDCPAGAYCPNTLMTATQPCPVGYYCPSNSYFTGLGIYYEAILCPLGTYNDLQSKTQLSDCKACPAGNYCGAEGLSTVSGTCSAGYFCKTNAIYAAPAFTDVSGNYGLCPVGYYCASSTSTPTACLAGTYSKMTKSQTNANCKSCEPGYYCATAGLSAPTGQCDAGYYCAVGSSSNQAAQCTATNYCPQGSPNEERCPIGFYNTATIQGKCVKCDAGSTCFDGQKADCPKGYFCP